MPTISVTCRDGGKLAGVVSIRDLVKHRITMHQRDL